MRQMTAKETTVKARCASTRKETNLLRRSAADNTHTQHFGTGLRNPLCLSNHLQMANPDAVRVFKDLAEQFELDPAVTSWLTAADGLAAKNLDDLLYACNGDGIDKLVGAAKPTNLILSTSRLRQAWRSLKKARDEDDVIKRAGQDTMDMDDLLTASVLDDIEARHWARYKKTWPPEIAPADTLISRFFSEKSRSVHSASRWCSKSGRKHTSRGMCPKGFEWPKASGWCQRPRSVTPLRRSITIWPT